MKMNNEAAAALATTLAQGGNSFMMCGDGENVEILGDSLHRQGFSATYVARNRKIYHPSEDLVKKIIADSKTKQAEKEARRAARWFGAVRTTTIKI